MLNRRLFMGFFSGLLSIVLFLLPMLTPQCFPLNQAAWAQEKEAVAVLELRAMGNLAPEEAELVTSRVRSLVVQNPRFRVLEREGMDRILKEQGFQSTQNCENEACSVQVGRLLAVRKIITGGLSKVGGTYTLSLRMIDVENGTILAERFVDCNCSREALLFEQVSPLLKQLLGESASSNSSNSSQSPSSGSIRKRKAFHIGFEGGYSDYWAALSLGYNINEYFALRLGGTYHQTQFLGGISTIPSGYGAMAAARVYFNPHDLAGFGEIAATTELWFIPRLGLEYRNDWGLNLWGALGWRYNYINGGIFDAMGGIGYAF